MCPKWPLLILLFVVFEGWFVMDVFEECDVLLFCEYALLIAVYCKITISIAIKIKIDWGHLVFGLFKNA